ncbi:hypothetical protein D0Z07_5520 [Hyphodiscus hymeniophilus]|uniref:Uncharacterized protein n=1 Tax=Hyphodiscus hymeniophilus TaxID=353542 RepID=A0A9P6VIA3_9HELO|nr:hypothetical protein D0Z07_5520 [Hyphodiscus hymeniophilus]
MPDPTTTISSTQSKSESSSSSTPSHTPSNASPSAFSATPPSIPSGDSSDNLSDDDAAISSILSSLGVTATEDGPPATTLTVSSGLATPTTIVLSQNQTQQLETLQTCFQNDSVPIVIQNATSWNETGCNLGFYCQFNTAQYLPQYCPPLPQCQAARLSGATCPPQSKLEPVICKGGYYCPKGGASQIKCPEGSFCPQGSYRP